MKLFLMSLLAIVAFPCIAGVVDFDSLSDRSIIGANNLELIESVIGTDYYETSRAIARVEAGGGGYCTAFRVADDLFMTNYHCSVFKPCAQTSFHMGFEKSLPKEKHVFFQCVELLTSLEKLDIAVYRTKRIASPAIDDYPFLTLARRTLLQGTPIFLPAHAGTFEKRIDRSDECIVVKPTPYDYYNRRTIGHNCDSESGSSGGPIIAKADHVVVAIHWGGTDSQAGENTNHGILMKDILEYLDQTLPAVVGELTITP